ncbi:hypothetical protein LCGC14_0628130 [marine sediment metagenome]|uniref:Uncharacterized protein n=1 Tax=marine sediment metagenome TaxID=412755 RepID=A0A0F9UBA3_9ZZZZ
MPFTTENLRDEVKSLVQDDAKFITDKEVDTQGVIALRMLNLDRPRRVPKDITGDNTSSYDIESLGFVKQYSDVKTVEYPAGETPPVMRRRDDIWFIYEDPSKPSGQQLRLRFFTLEPNTTETIRVTFTVPFVIADLADTGFNALVFKNASLVLAALGSRFAQTTDSSIDADAVDYAGRSNNFIFLSEKYEKDYKRMAGLSDTTKAAQAIGENDIIYPTGDDLFWHPRNTR